MTAEVKSIIGEDVDFPEELDAAIGEMYVSFLLDTVRNAMLMLVDLLCSVRAPTADLPNMAAFLGGLVAQEAIKVITEQYVPLNGYCVVDLIDSWTGVIG